MEVALTGGTGFVGRELTRSLVALGYRPRLVVRSDQSKRSSEMDRARIEVVRADLSNPAQLESAFRGAAAVCHLVGIISECGDQTFERVHAGLTASVLDAARAAGVQRYLHMSALGTREGARSRYHQSKWAAEERVRGSGLDWSIFRPAIIFGAEDQFTRFFARMSTWSPVLPVFGGGRNELQPIEVTQVARAFVAALSRPATIHQTYELCGPERLTFRQLLRAILEALGRRRLILSIPFPLARIQALGLEILFGQLLQRPPPLNRDQLLMLEEDNIGDGLRADRELELYHEPIRSALNRLLAHPLKAAGDSF